MAGRVCGMIGTALLALGLCLFFMRSCASARPDYATSGPPMTVDGQPVSPEERQTIEAQIKASNSQHAGSQSATRSPK